ncbi:MOV10 [Symbiodinium sp. CCMP2456]|nr:MOV10 [Symbiodinium sp. CCMP2456]
MTVGRALPDFPLPTSLTVVDHTVKNTDVATCSVPYILPAAPQAAFDNVARFVDSELAAIIEMFREEMGQATSICGTKPPMEQHLHLRYSAAPATCRIEASGEAMAKMHLMPLPVRFPPEDSRSMWSKFMLLAQARRPGNQERVANVGLVFCETMTQRDGLVLRARVEVLEQLRASMLQPGTFTYFRKLRNFSFMVTSPAASLQKLRSAQPTPLCRALFLGDVPQASQNKAELFERLDTWVIANPDAQKMFNPQQCRALALEALTEAGPVVVQGPPGTGKSHLIACGLLPQIIRRGGRILVLCNSNVAVDSIGERVLSNPASAPGSHYASAKFRCLRVGFEKKVSQKVLLAKWFRKENGFHDELRSGQKSVVFTTLHNASVKHEEFQAENFDVLILDEAGQVEDMKLFILVQKLPSLKKVILVGDHKQLQPYVSDGVREQGYGRSTMERLISCELTPAPGKDSSALGHPVDYIMLEEQHRMPPTVRNIVSQLFYGSKLRDGPNILMKYCQPGKTAKPTVVAFDLSFGATEFNPFQRSLENSDEAAITKMIYDRLLKAPGTAYTTRDICVLSPYNRHKNRLRTVIAGIPEADWAKWENLDTDVAMDSSMDSKTAAVRNIDTVDKFQGSEREVVIINTVTGGSTRASAGTGQETSKRANDPHFINVAISRCKGMLVLIGKLSQLGGSWQVIMENLQQQVQARSREADILVIPCGSVEDARNGVEAFFASMATTREGGSLEGPDAKRLRATM